MIALVTSCINPFKQQSDLSKSYIDTEQRLNQTIATLNKLAAYDFNKIYLLDNSQSFDFSLGLAETSAFLSVKHYQQYQFNNKGINELLLLLAILDELPDDEIIFKISGRYYPNEKFICRLADGFDFKFKQYHFKSKKGAISTRGYFIRNKKVYEDFLLKCLNEVFAYPKRIVGLRSALNALNEIIKPLISAEYNTSIEFAAARVLKANAYKAELVDTIGIEGQIAGFKTLDLIKE